MVLEGNSLHLGVCYMQNGARCDSSMGAAGLGALAAKIGGADFDGAAHLKEAGAHAAADAFFERIFARGGHEFAVGKAGGFAGGSGIVEIIGGDDGGALLVVAGVENDADDVQT